MLLTGDEAELHVGRPISEKFRDFNPFLPAA
jgi:hypothetical protein